MKLSQLLIDGDLLVGWLKHGCATAVPVANHLPDDARLYGVYNAHPGIIGLVFSSEAFPEAPEGHNPAMLPVLQPVVIRTAAPAQLVTPSRN